MTAIATPNLLTLFQASKASGIGYQTLTAAYKAGNLKPDQLLETGPKRKIPLFSKAAIDKYAATKSTQTVEKAAAYLGLDLAQAAQLREQYVKGGKPNKITIL